MREPKYDKLLEDHFAKLDGIFLEVVNKYITLKSNLAKELTKGVKKNGKT